MPDTAHDGILDRFLFSELIREPFRPQFELLDQLVNYGTNLIPRSYESSSKGLPDAVVIASFLKHAVTSLDAIGILARQAATLSCIPHIRSIFEIGIYLRWIFAEDFTQRATAYFVWEVRRKRYWLRCYLEGTPEYAAHKEHMKGSLGENIVIPHSQPELLKALEVEEARLTTPATASVNVLFDAMAKKSGKDVEWFAPFGPRSIRALAEDVGEGASYKVFYSYYSRVTHGLSFEHQLHFRASEQQLIFDHIRTVDQLDRLMRDAFNAIIPLYRSVLEHYRPGELDAFSRKYTNEWRSALNSIPKVKKEGSKFSIIPKKPGEPQVD